VAMTDSDNETTLLTTLICRAVVYRQPPVPAAGSGDLLPPGLRGAGDHVEQAVAGDGGVKAGADGLLVANAFRQAFGRAGRHCGETRTALLPGPNGI